MSTSSIAASDSEAFASCSPIPEFNSNIEVISVPSRPVNDSSETSKLISLDSDSALSASTLSIEDELSDESSSSVPLSLSESSSSFSASPFLLSSVLDLSSPVVFSDSSSDSSSDVSSPEFVPSVSVSASSPDPVPSLSSTELSSASSSVPSLGAVLSSAGSSVSLVPQPAKNKKPANNSIKYLINIHSLRLRI